MSDEEQVMTQEEWKDLTKEDLQALYLDDLQRLCSSLNLPPQRRDNKSPGIFRQTAKKSQLIALVLNKKADVLGVAQQNPDSSGGTSEDSDSNDDADEGDAKEADSTESDKQRDPDDEAAEWVPSVSDDYIEPEPQAAEFQHSLLAGDDVLIVGPAGTGKSMLVEKTCEELNWPRVRITGHSGVSAADLIGEWTVQDGETVFNYGLVPMAARMGAILQVEEVTAIPPGIALALHTLLEERQMAITATSEVIEAHDDFRVVGTDNTTGFGDESGLYGGTFMQNQATMQRFEVTLRLEHPDVKRENQILKKAVPQSKYDQRQSLIKLANDIRQSHENDELMLDVSVRVLENTLEKLVEMDDPRRAIEITLTNRLPESDRETVLELAQRHIGFEL